MKKLTSADHVTAIIAALPAGEWLPDWTWHREKNDKKWREVILPPRIDRRDGRFAVIAVAPRDYVEANEPLWPDRSAWDSRNAAQLTPPFARTHFKRISKRKADGTILRTFSTPCRHLEAVTHELDGRIVRIELVEREVGGSVVYAVDEEHIQEIPQTDAAVPTAYDVVDGPTLERAIIEAAMDRLVADGRYPNRDELAKSLGGLQLQGAVSRSWPLSKKIEADVSIVEFDSENVDAEDFGAPGFEGISTIGDFTFLGLVAGGDWEAPVAVILYMSEGRVRGYVPDGGNHYDRKTMKAFGNGDSDDDEEAMEAAEDGEWDVEALKADITRRFGLSA